MLTRINTEYIKNLNPCTSGWENYLEHYETWEGSALEFANLKHIPIEDKQWLLLRSDFLTEEQLHLYGCFCAESVLHIFEKEFPNDNRPRIAIEAKRRRLKGEVTDKELADAARAAARAADAAYADAADAVARAAVYAADAVARAYAAVYSAARAVAAVGAAEKEKQLTELKRILKEN